MALFLRSPKGTGVYIKNQPYTYLGTGFYPSQDHVFARPGRIDLNEPYVVSVAYPGTQDGLHHMKKEVKGLTIVQMNVNPSLRQMKMLVELHRRAASNLNWSFGNRKLEEWFPAWNKGVRTQTARALVRKGFLNTTYLYDEEEGTMHGWAFYITNLGNKIVRDAHASDQQTANTAHI